MSREAIAGLYVLVDDDPRWPHDPVDQARAALEGGATLLQLRVKHSGDDTTLAWGRAIRRLSAERGALFIVNDRFDLALACGADGVHLGQHDLPPGRLPRGARSRLLVGRSTHTLDQVRVAAREDVDYLAFGPVFGTDSKASEYSARGLPLLAEACGLRGRHPMVAIGGIGPGRVGPVLDAGASAVCVLSALAAADDPVAATRALLGELPDDGASAAGPGGEAAGG